MAITSLKEDPVIKWPSIGFYKLELMITNNILTLTSMSHFYVPKIFFKLFKFVPWQYELLILTQQWPYRSHILHKWENSNWNCLVCTFLRLSNKFIWVFLLLLLRLAVNKNIIQNVLLIIIRYFENVLSSVFLLQLDLYEILFRIKSLYNNYISTIKI